VRQFAPLETADLRLILNGVHALEAKLLAPPDLLLPLGGRQRRLFLQRFHALQTREIRQRALVLAMIWGVSMIKSHVD